MSLVFHTMQGTNFCTLLHLPPFKLSGRGMVLILGDNQDAPKADSNGAGKSLLCPELFTWTLWGQTIRRLKADEVVNDVVGKNCFGEVSFSVGGHTYIVRRYRKHDKGTSKLTNEKENDLILVMDGLPATGANMADTQEQINNLLGITFPIFEAMMPGTGVKAAQLGDAGIKGLLEEILQTKVYAVALQIVKDRLRDLKHRMDRETRNLEAINGTVCGLEVDVQRYRGESASFAEKKAQRVADAQERLFLVRDEFENAKMDRALKEITVETLSTEEQCKQKLGVITTLHAEQAQHTARVAEHLSVLSTADAGYEVELQQVRTFMERIQNIGPECSECLQGVADEHKAHQIEQCEGEISRLTMIMQAVEGKRQKIQQAHESVLQDFDDRLSTCNWRADAATIEYLKRVALLAQIDALQALEESKRVAIPGAQEAFEEARAEENPFEDLIAQAASSLAKGVEEEGESESRIQEMQETNTQLEFWLHGFSTKGIRSHMLKSVTPVLNEITRKNCEVLTGSEMSITFSTQTTLGSGEVREKFDIQVTQAHGGNTYKKNSEGEKQRADVVIAMSIADLAAMRTSFPIRFLDEPFVKVDESGTDAIIQLLRQYEAEYDTIFVVTHQEQVKSMFAKPLTMVKSGGVSRLEGDN